MSVGSVSATADGQRNLAIATLGGLGDCTDVSGRSLLTLDVSLWIDCGFFALGETESGGSSSCGVVFIWRASIGWLSVGRLQ